MYFLPGATQSPPEEAIIFKDIGGLTFHLPDLWVDMDTRMWCVPKKGFVMVEEDISSSYWTTRNMVVAALGFLFIGILCYYVGLQGIPEYISVDSSVSSMVQEVFQAAPFVCTKEFLDSLLVPKNLYMTYCHPYPDNTIDLYYRFLHPDHGMSLVYIPFRNVGLGIDFYDYIYAEAMILPFVNLAQSA